MRLSKLVSKTSKQVPKDEVSVNSKLLIKAGYIDKVAAGIYSYLPLGQRVLNNISNIIREEMDAIGGQEVVMPVLHPKENWEKTGRWNGFDVLFKVKGHSGDFAMGPSHEEIVVPLTQQFVKSYTDLPKYVYQIQTKFRDEPRAKSGLLRGREFLMKDLYSFHTDKEDFEKYYKKAQDAYTKIFKRCGLDSILTDADGGTFSKFSHEFQVLSDDGEDTIFYCTGKGCGLSQNKEIATVKAGDKCKKCAESGHDEIIKTSKSIEVGNTFPLKDKYSKAFNFNYVDKAGREHSVLMGCYGIGISRLMGAVVEVHHDENGIIWPESVAPYSAHLMAVGNDKKVRAEAEQIYKKFTSESVEVLFDDRVEVSTGEKFADADLIGLPSRIVFSKKIGKGKVEVKQRDQGKGQMLSITRAFGKS